MRERQVRVIAIGIIRRGDEMFVAEGFDSVKKSYFYRPLGGEIEFGEYGYETLAREFREEIQADLKGIRYLFTVENLFSVEGRRGHEIVQVYEASFADATFYERTEVEGTDDSDFTFTALWISLETFKQNRERRLVPEALLERL